MFPDEDNKDYARWNDFDCPLDNQTNCPFASHMRKTRGRGMINDRDVFDIMRRGISYGPEVGPYEKKNSKTILDRGLIFTCYQSSLSNGFQFIKHRKSGSIQNILWPCWLSNFQGWINPDTFPADKTDFTGGMNPGQDAIVGQSVKGAFEEDDKILYTSIYDGNKQHNKVTFEPFVRANGGDYLITPSLKLFGDFSVAPAV